MGFFSLIRHNIRRNTRRSALTFLAICVSLCLYTILTTAGATLDRLMAEAETSLVLHVQNADARSHRDSRLPEVYGERIAQLEGVAAVTSRLMSSSQPAEGGGFVPAIGVDLASYLLVGGGGLPDEDDPLYAAFVADENSLLVGGEVAARYGWQTGDRVTLTPAMGTGMRDTFTALVRPPTGGWDDDNVVMRLDRLQRLAGLEGVVMMFEVRAESLDAVPTVMGGIDQQFANDPVRTRTLPGMAYLLKFLAQLESIALGLRLIALAALVSTLIVAANSIAMSTRERTREVGVLKALGFRRAQIGVLIAGEALLLALGGGLVGCLLAYAPLSLGLVRLPSDILGAVRAEPTVLLSGIGLALLIGLLGGLLPALGAARLHVVEALRHVG